MKFNKIVYSLATLSLLSNTGFAQQQSENLPPNATLQQLIDYALRNQISVKQAQLDEAIGEKDIDISLSGWYPQLGLKGSYNYNVIVPVVNIGGNNIKMGQNNASALTLQADQQLLNPELIQAKKAASLVRLGNKQNTESKKINAVVEVSKAYYDILTTEEMIKIVRENIARLQKQLKDAKSQYDVGVVDKTDFKRAQIALANSNADEKRNVELRKYKYEYLKQLLALDKGQNLTLSFSNSNMESEILLDTTAAVSVSNRIEFQQLETSKKIQQLNTQYFKWTYLPSISAFYNYAFNYRNDKFSKLYNDNFPGSVAGLNLSFSIFDGFKRKKQVNKSRLQEERIDWDIKNLENSINTEYALSKATYNANLNDWKTAKENVELSKEVYETIKLQYDEGITKYLDLMTAENDLKITQFNYLSALYALLSSKLDVQKAVGAIQTN